MRKTLFLLTALITQIAVTGQQGNAVSPRLSPDNQFKPDDQVINTQAGKKNALTAKGIMENPYAGRDSSLVYTYSTVLDSMPSKRYKYQHSENETTELYYQYDENDQDWIPTTKTTFIYNENGNLIEETEMRWKASIDDWNPVNKEITTFNEAGFKTSQETQLWDEAEAEWYVYEKFEQSFNESNQKKDSIYFKHTDAEGLNPKTKVNWYYNNNNKLDSVKHYSHNGSEYVDSIKLIYFYNDDGLKEKRMHWYWYESISSWQISYKWEFSYNDQNKQTTKEKSSWNFTLGWSPQKKINTGYNSEGYENVSIAYEWDSGNGEYVPQNKVEFTYPTNIDTSAIESLIGYTYDIDSETFVYSYKNVVEYTDYGAWSFFLQMFWDENNSEWIPDVKFDYHHNSSHQMTISERHEKAPNTNDWKLKNKTFYYYSAPSAIPANEDNIAFSVYPVPARSSVTFSLDAADSDDITLSVYNTSGQLVHREKVSNAKQDIILNWDVSGNPSGIYTAVVKTSEAATTRKIIVK